jgi:hypothetical protein
MISFLETTEIWMTLDKEKEWTDRARRFLKAELKRADVGYQELAKRLEKHGLKETEASVANKLSRGTFAATFFLASLTAIGCESVRLEDV